MRWNRFGRSLLFAALAAGGFPVARVLLDPIFGSYLATHGYLVGAAALYAMAIAPSPRRGIAGAALITLLGGALVLTGCRTSELALGLAAGVALARSALLYRVRATRGIAIELALGLAGLLLAQWFVGPGLLGGSLALWGYLLVQSVYFPLVEGAPRAGVAAQDPFAQARARLQVLLREAEG
jgi:hypothetical protein